MGLTTNLFSTVGLVESKPQNNLQRIRNTSSKESFDRVLNNKKSEIINQNSVKSDEQQESISSPKVKKLESIGISMVNHFDKGGTKTESSSDSDNSESKLIDQINNLINLVSELTQKLHAIIGNQNKSTDGSKDQNLDTTKELEDIKNILDDLVNMGNFPLIQELISSLTVGKNIQLLDAQTLNLDSGNDINILSTNNELPTSISNNELVELLSGLRSLLAGTENVKAENALGKLKDSFSDLISNINLLSSNSQNDPKFKEILTNLNGIISTVQSKLTILDKVPSIIGLIAKMPKINSEPKDGSTTDTDTLENSKNISSDNTLPKELKVHKESIKLDSNEKVNVSQDKTLEVSENENIGLKNQDLQVPLINNELVNKQQLNIQEIVNISKNQLGNLNDSKDVIFGQLVQKATLMVKEGFSEMKMQLRPDFLGKVDLQISVERGIVTAKFAAENQQVKALIESNLSNLKQNLTNQGIKIDQISVSVGSQQNLNDNSRRSNQQTNSRNSKKYKLDDGESYGLILSNELEGLTKSWYSESTVDYTA